jgi:Ig-like domain from next to BRCA1 gene
MIVDQNDWNASGIIRNRLPLSRPLPLDNFPWLTQNQLMELLHAGASIKRLAKGKNSMSHLIKPLSRIGILLSLLWVAACSSATPTSTPTPDLNPIRTDVAATVWAQVTQAILLTPSVTPMPSPTATTLPTSTRTASPSPGPSVTPSTSTPGATGTNQAQWVSQSVADGTTFAPDEAFTMTWTLKNVGTATWTAKYLFRFFGGDSFGAANEIPLGQEVPPGGTVDITLKMKAPANAGNYVSNWVVSTENRSNFKEPVFLKITVAVPVTPTRTATTAPTASPTPSPTP